MCDLAEIVNFWDSIILTLCGCTKQPHLSYSRPKQKRVLVIFYFIFLKLLKLRL